MTITLPIRTTTALYNFRTQSAIRTLFAMADQQERNQLFASQNYLPDTQADRWYQRLEFAETPYQTEIVHLTRALAVDDILQATVHREIARMDCLLKTQPSLIRICYFADGVGILRRGIFQQGGEEFAKMVKASASLISTRAETPSAAIVRHDSFKRMLWAWSDCLLNEHPAYAGLKQPTIDCLLKT